MLPESASAATPASNGDIPEPIAPSAPIADPNALSTELSEEDETALIDRSFGITDPGLPLDIKEKEDNIIPKPADSGDDKKPLGNDGDGKPAKAEQETHEAPAKTEPEEPAAPEAVDTSDLWIEIEDSEGKSHKIGVGDSLPDDFAFKNDAQLAEYLEARREMRDTLKDRNTEIEESKAAQQSKDSEAAQVASWDTEIQDLIGAGLIEAPKTKPGDKDFMQDPSVQKIDAIFKFMASENTKRANDGKPKIISFGTAYTLWSNDKAKIEAEEKLKKDNEIAKQRGSLVGGSSSSSSGGKTTDGLYIQGSAGTIHDVDFSDLE